MLYPVKVLKPNGKVKRVITSEELERRSDAILKHGDRFNPAEPLREFRCAECGKKDWANHKQKTKRFCDRKCAEKYNSRKLVAKRKMERK